MDIEKELQKANEKITSLQLQAEQEWKVKKEFGKRITEALNGRRMPNEDEWDPRLKLIRNMASRLKSLDPDYVLNYD